MLELEQLIQLKAFYENKTLSKAAEKLHISQPVLTRTMKLIEEEMGVPLFERTRNRITFNENGILMVEYVNRILDDVKLMKDRVRENDRKNSTFMIGSCAPAPARFLSINANDYIYNKTITSEIKDMNILVEGLKDGTYNIIAMPYDIEDDEIESIEFMDEQLFFSLPVEHKYADRTSLKYSDMDGESMLLMSNIGFWYDMHKKTQPHTRFLVQPDYDSFYDILELSYLPCFVSDKTNRMITDYDSKYKNRVIIPIEDPESHATFYVWYLKKNEKMLKTFLYSL